MTVFAALHAVLLVPTAATAQHPITAEIRAPSSGITARPGEKFSITLAVDIPSTPTTWHLYSITQPPGGPIATRIKVLPASDFRVAGKIIGSPPDIAEDPNFNMMTETHVDSAIYRIPVVANPAGSGSKRLIVSLYYQTCNDRYCLPPREDTLGVTVMLAGAPASGSTWMSSAPAAASASKSSKATATVAGPASGGSTTGTPSALTPNGGAGAPNAPATTPGATPAASSSAIPAATTAAAGATSAPAAPGGPVLPGNGSLTLFLWIAATMGALSLLTPCVFPMVPITISYFSRGEARGRTRAFRDAGVYALGIIAAFTTIGLFLALFLGATGLNRFAANPWLNLGIAVLFAGFALSLFGVLNLGVPGGFVNRIDSLTRNTRFGRDGTTLLMGATFALTTFTCTAPFVGTLLVSATQGDWLWPALGLLVFSAVFAIPFVVLALVPEALTRLPRSGEWMVTLKGVLAFLELAAAMKFLSNADLVEGWGVFTRNVVLATWVLLGIGLVAYLLGARLSGRSLSRAKPHFVPAVIAAMVIAWLSMGLAGRRLGELEPFLPPAGSNASGVANSGELSWMLDDYEGALAQAKAENKLVLIDFTGYTCTNCRWMEANMFPREDVQQELSKFVRVRLFTDGREDSNVRQQQLEQQKFNTVALPLYAIVDANGEARGQFLGMTRKSDEFIAFLSGGQLAER